MSGQVVPGTVACWRLKDPLPTGPYTALCACGWWLGDRSSQRQAKRAWHFHLQRVRNSVTEAA